MLASVAYYFDLIGIHSYTHQWYEDFENLVLLNEQLMTSFKMLSFNLWNQKLNSINKPLKKTILELKKEKKQLSSSNYTILESEVNHGKSFNFYDELVDSFTSYFFNEIMFNHYFNCHEKCYEEVSKLNQQRDVLYLKSLCHSIAIINDDYSEMELQLTKIVNKSLETKVDKNTLDLVRL